MKTPEYSTKEALQLLAEVELHIKQAILESRVSVVPIYERSLYGIFRKRNPVAYKICVSPRRTPSSPDDYEYIIWDDYESLYIGQPSNLRDARILLNQIDPTDDGKRYGIMRRIKGPGDLWEPVIIHKKT